MSSHEKLYRPAVGIVLFNNIGKVWLGRRFGQRGDHVWQFPQGGIDAGEDPQSAALRELWEETGLKSHHVHYLDTIPEWLYYDFPQGYKSSKGWHGQKQRWFAFKFIGRSSDFNLKAHPPVEFSRGRWEDLSLVSSLIVPFKRPVYERIQIEFKRFAIQHI